MENKKMNIVCILTDQLRSDVLPVYGGTQVATPNIDRLASEGITLGNAVSSCPVCTPYRSMMLTGRYPQTTGHLINFVNTRHDEIGMGDVFTHAGYETGWIGKWHLHTGSFPEVQGWDYVPEGRDRLGFSFWRGYNFHSQYFDGSVNLDDWHCEKWEGYETDALVGYARDFFDRSAAVIDADTRPFCLVLSPHQCHNTFYRKYAPERYYDDVPETPELSPNVPTELVDESRSMLRHYLAMVLALDDMVGAVLQELDERGLSEDTIVLFTSDHGTQAGSHGYGMWEKMLPYPESYKVPFIIRLPSAACDYRVSNGGIQAGESTGPFLMEGSRSDLLISPVDILPTFCGLTGISVPRTVEGMNLAPALLREPYAATRDAVFTMGFTADCDFLRNGNEWRGVVGPRYSFTRWLDGRIELFDLQEDPYTQYNLAESGDPNHAAIRDCLDRTLQGFMSRYNDELIPCEEYTGWFDAQRRIVRNAHGLLGDPEDEPDWSLLRRMCEFRR